MKNLNKKLKLTIMSALLVAFTTAGSNAYAGGLKIKCKAGGCVICVEGNCLTIGY